MGRLGCSIDGHLNEAKFSKPMPWIGIYVAAASLACAAPMAFDAIRGFRQRKFWFPCKYFSLNATSLTIIAVAIKFSVDLNTAMPQKQDQLAKVSSAVLICTVMGNTMPSLGTMETKELCMNIIALGILVVTMIVNICIQLGTGVIFVFWREHAFIMFLMLVLLVILSFSALTVPINKQYLEMKCKKKYEIALQESSNEVDRPVVKKLKEDLMKHWIMAHTCSPQFVMGRSVTCTASGALCLLSALTLAETMLRSYLMPWSFKFCTGESDYKWSTTLVLVAQTIAVGVGTIAPAFRWFTAINFRCPNRGKKICINRIFKVERYWMQMLEELKECPLVFRIKNRRCRKFLHDAKNLFLNVCIRMQIGIVLASKGIQLISIYFVSRILLFCDFCTELKKFKPNNSISNDSRSESQSSSNQDLSRFVLHLEGENELVEIIMKHNCDATGHWIRMAKKQQPKHLLKLLKKSNSEGFKGVQDFDSYLVPSLESDEPPNCWALPVVTLTSIAVALPNINSCLVKKLMHSVHEGLMYVKNVEENQDVKGDMLNIRKAADSVWLGVDLYHLWLDVNLRKLSLQANSPREILEALADAAKNRYMEYKKTDMNHCAFKESPLKWPVKALAAYSMYRISQTIMLDNQSRNCQTSERLFEVLTIMISDIIGACLTNLPRVISLKCLSSTIEEREVSVRDTVFLLGKSEEILKILDRRGTPSLHPDQMACIDEWRSPQKLKERLLSIPSISSTSSELCLTIE
ncbi:putative Plant/MNJ7-17 protein [Melia azedarach]|uniref:Plant/MNJ7-17 protein n=1 Tax=Melia azedarach TaxID=155640 RepID=A0ACC1XMY3_MELAZ|nr:putative Plant/MNJ7-17 protein [Melia azedarach]